MIDKLTKENLQKLGFKEADVNELFNTTGDYNLQCNEGNVFVSKPEDKLYTGIDMYRKIYFTEKNINFPFKCPDLFDEYFELSLAKFFDKQKAELSIHFDEKTQFGKFILLETNRSNEIIKDTKEYIKAHPNTLWIGKERANNILETYIQFLDNKLFVNQQNNIKKPEPTFFDFIHNVEDKEKFAKDLKETFNTEFGKDFVPIITLLQIEKTEILKIPELKFKAFYEVLQVYFNRDIGKRQSIWDEIVKQSKNGLTEMDNARLKKIEKKLYPLIDRNIIK